MDAAMFAIQNKLKDQLNLKRVKVVQNPNYTRDGTKSYVSSMKRYGFQPTKESKYFQVEVVKMEGEHKWMMAKTRNNNDATVKADPSIWATGHLEDELKYISPQSKAAMGGVSRLLMKMVGTPENKQAGEVTAEDQQYDSMYLCKVQIGEPAQSFLLDFDTGSADLWVRSTNAPRSAQRGHNVFDPEKSKTFKNLGGKKWKIQYGDGSSASGTCGSDILTVGGITIKDQTIELASKLSPAFERGTGDGLLGLAFSSINTVRDYKGPDPQASPVENMIAQKDIPPQAELFTSCFYSWRDTDTSDGTPKESFYTFGYIDQDLVGQLGEDIHWTNVDNSKGFWSINSASASVNGRTISVPGNTAIVDTGTTLALLSDKVVEALYDQIPGARYSVFAQGYIFPTNVSAKSLPELKVAVGSKLYLIQPEDLVFAPTDDGKWWYGGVQSRGDMPFDILGDTFLKSCYAIWDVGNKRFGAVPKIEKNQNLALAPGQQKLIIPSSQMMI
ncbi:aspartic endopeptidase [Camillea tinctor]|nr:aspartic endopeptidase [Camillea tinctor]